jgi:hypothetical protein
MRTKSPYDGPQTSDRRVYFSDRASALASQAAVRPQVAGQKCLQIDLLLKAEALLWRAVNQSPSNLWLDRHFARRGTWVSLASDPALYQVGKQALSRLVIKTRCIRHKKCTAL